MATAASSVFDLGSGGSCLDDASSAFAATVSAAIAEPDAASSLAGSKTS
jgi:hypothetical protein